MKKKVIIIVAVIIVLLITALSIAIGRVCKLKNDRNRYIRNTETLMRDVERYQTKDSLNVARVGVLELKLSEYKDLRAGDYELIKSLQTKNRKLHQVTTTQAQTIINLRGNVRDSIVYVEKEVDHYITDTLQCLDIANKWYELHGCVNKENEFTGRFTNRDSITIVETVRYKRFWGFLWYTNKIKDRKVDVVSKNPYTKIENVEYIEIRKK